MDFTRITTDPARMGGVPCIRNLRIPVAIVDALRVPGVGRKTTARLLALGLLRDPHSVQSRARTAEEAGIAPRAR